MKKAFLLVMVGCICGLSPVFAGPLLVDCSVNIVGTGGNPVADMVLAVL